MPRRVSFSPDQVPTREPGSDAEFIRVAGQKQPQLVRTYDSTLREWNYTALGRQFFANKTVEYVVSIPVRISVIARTNWANIRGAPNCP
jgi:hypothetical protein